MLGPQLVDAISNLFPFDVEISMECDGDDDLVITVEGATLDLAGLIKQNAREYEVRGEITIPYVWRGEAVDEDDARDKAEAGPIAVYIDDISPPTGHGIEGLEIFPPDYTLNTTREV